MKSPSLSCRFPLNNKQIILKLDIKMLQAWNLTWSKITLFYNFVYFLPDSFLDNTNPQNQSSKLDIFFMDNVYSFQGNKFSFKIPLLVCLLKTWSSYLPFPAYIYLFKVSIRNTRTMCEVGLSVYNYYQLWIDFTHGSSVTLLTLNK